MAKVLTDILAVVMSPLVQAVGLALLYLVLIFVLGKKSQIDAWCLKNPQRAGIVKTFRSLFPDPLLFLQGITLIVLKRMPTAYQVLKNLEALEAARRTNMVSQQPRVDPTPGNPTTCISDCQNS